jgi:hypothetical protein
MPRTERGGDQLLAAFAVFDQAETLPPFDAFLELGRELHAVRLDSFIDGAIPSGDVAASFLRFSLSTAARCYEEKHDAETKARLNDEGHLRNLYDQIAAGGWWLHIRDQARKFARLALAERDARRPLKGTPHDKIVAELKKKAPAKGWRVVSTKNRIQQIGKEYAENNGLDPPAPRRSPG